jgi:tRNA uridine 5-carboxymethylaminomethyl modification enzyme
MFTSRAEYRLTLREDNARDRLMKYATQYGLIPQSLGSEFDQLRSETDIVIKRLKKKRIRVDSLGNLNTRFKKAETISLENLLKQPNISVNEALSLLAKFDGDLTDNPEVLTRATIFIRYSGYIDKQQREIDKFQKLENQIIPLDFDYQNTTGLKKEAVEKLKRFQPRSLGQAGRLEGVTPGDIAVLSVYLHKHKSLSV